MYATVLKKNHFIGEKSRNERSRVDFSFLEEMNGA